MSTNNSDISQVIKIILSNVKIDDRPPILLSTKDIDMIIDGSYYSIKMNIIKNGNSSNNHINISTNDNIPLTKAKTEIKPEITNKINFSELPEKNISINDTDLDKYIKQAENYISNINIKTRNSIENEQNLNIEELLTQIPSSTNLNNINAKIEINNTKNSNIILPFDFIKNYEIDNYIHNSNILNDENYFILEDYRKKQRIRYNPMEYIIKEKMFKQIYKNNVEITCIDAKNGILFVGNNLGTIKTYSIEKNYEYKNYESSDLMNLNNRNISVSCIKSSPDNETFVSGHDNGAIILWETYSTKIKRFISPSKKINNKIICIRYMVKENGFYTLIISDIDGKIKLLTIYEGYFMTSVCIQTFINKPKPCYLIENLNFDNEEKNLYNVTMENIKNYICLIGNEDSIEIFILSLDSNAIASYTTGNIDYKIQNVLEINNPLSNFNIKKGNFINYPSASFGYGYLSHHINNKNNDDENENDSEEDEEVGKNKTEKINGDILMAVSWHNTIIVYSIPINDNKIQNPVYIGYYKDLNINNIIHIGFFSVSIIFYVDDNNNIKLVNTNLIKNSDNNFNNNDTNNNQEKDNLKSSVNSVIENDNKINDFSDYKEIVLNDKNLMCVVNNQQNVKIYSNFIVAQSKNIYILSRKNFNHIKLYSWEQCLMNMKNNFDWITMFCLGINIYKGHSSIKTLADIPNETYYRKTKVKYVLKKIIKEYFSINLTNELTKNSNFDFVNITIETCINIEALDFLLDDIQRLIDTKGFGDLFLEKIEPFILKDKIKDQILAPTTLNTLIEFYTNQGKIYDLSQLLPHLHIKCLDCELIRKVSVQYDFFSTLIYIYTNSKNDYFTPLILMNNKFNTMVNENNINNLFMDVISGKTIEIFNEKIKIYENFEKTKEYLGFKIFWYLYICLKGQKYPKFNELIDDDTYSDIITVLFIFYCDASNLRLFDSYTYFNILEIFFSDKNILNLIKKINRNNLIQIQNKNNIQLFTNNDNMDINIVTIITNGLYKIQNKSFYDKFDLSFFIIKICIYLEIQDNILYESLFYLLSYYKSVSTNYNSLKSKDNFNTHYKIIHFDSEYLKTFSKAVITAIDILKNSVNDQNIFFGQYLKNLINISNDSPFSLIKIHLFDLNNDINKCVELYLDDNSSLNNEEKFTVFSYINTKLELLQSNPYFFFDANNTNINHFNEFKIFISNKIEKLAVISIAELEKLILRWYKKEQISIIHKLDIVPEIQLQYLHFFMKEATEKYSNKEEELDDEMKNIYFFYFELLVKLGKNNYLISALKDNVKFYPLEKCLKLTLKNKFNEASIYIYEVLGKYSDALDIALNDIDIIYNKSKNILVNKDDFEIDVDLNKKSKDINDELYFKLQKNISTAVQICQKVSIMNLKNSNLYLNLWFNLFVKLFNIYIDIKSINKNNTIEQISLTLFINSEFENFLKNLYLYGGSSKIINYISSNKNIKKTEYEEFIEISTKILPIIKSYSILLDNSLLLYKNFSLNDINEYINLKTLGGEDFNFKKCDFCGKKFNNKKKSVALQCGHFLHLGCCLIYEQNPFCCICYDNVYDYQLSFPKNIISEKINEEPSEKQIETQLRRKKMHMFTKLDFIENRYFEESI